MWVQVTDLAQQHGLEGTGVQGEPSPSDPPQLGHVLTGAFTSRRHALWAARKATLDVATPPTQGGPLCCFWFCRLSCHVPCM